MSSLERLRSEMEDRNLETVIVTEEKNIEWLTGHAASGYFFVTQDGLDAIVPRFYLYDLEGVDCRYAFSGDEYADLLEERAENVTGEVVTDAENPEKLKEIFDAEHSGIVEDLREIKTEEEIRRMREACEIADRAFEEIRSELFSGITEWQAVSRIKGFYRERGVTDAFNQDGGALVQRNCLKPHRPPREDLIEEDDLVIVDTGARYEGYPADVTRTYCESPSEDQIKLFEDVKKIQEEMVEMIQPGVKLSKPMQRFIEMARELGYTTEENVLYFSHGIGLEVHERPRLSHESDGEFEEGMTITVEPGLHLPELGGVRIEDTVLVNSSSAERLSDAPKKL